MSTWIEVKKEDISIDRDGGIDINYSCDDNGSNYVTVNVKDIFEIIQAILMEG